MAIKNSLIKAAKNVISENYKEVFAQNVVRLDNLPVDSVAPGEFAPNEITDAENLVNKGNMANDTTFADKACPPDEITSVIGDAIDSARELLDISAKPEDGEKATLEIVKTTGDDRDCECKKHHYGHSAFGKMIESIMDGKSCEEFLKESNYPGPRDWNPDTRINVSDVLNAIKDEVGEGSEGVHVDQEYDERQNNVYKVSQIDLDKLPKTLHVETLILTLDGNKYIPNKISKEFPLGK